MDEVYAPQEPERAEEPGFYRPEGFTTSPPATPDQSSTTQPVSAPTITWTAAEYSYQAKSTSWRLLWGVGVIVTTALVWLVTRDFFPVVTVGIGCGLLGVYSLRQPSKLTYALNPYGLVIGDKQYAYHDFRSFSIAGDDELPGVDLVPLKRFGLAVTVHFEPSDAEQIFTYLSQYLPLTPSSQRVTDSLLRRLHF